LGPNRATEPLTRCTARAAQWNFVASALGAVSQFGTGVLLARLLAPEDFGIVVLALVVVVLVQPLSDLGVGNALIQRPALTERHVRCAATFAAVLGSAVAVAIGLIAPWAAAVLGDHRVAPVLRLLAAGIAIRGLAVAADALLRRQLDFRRQAAILTVSNLAGYGGVGVTLALSGHGVWSLAWGALAQTTLAAGGQLLVVRHSGRPLLARRELAELLHFGIGAAFSAWANQLALQGDNLVVGRWLGPISLGFYDRAYSLMNAPRACFASVISGVLFPAMSHVQDEPARLRRGYLVASRLTSLVAAPSMATLGVAAPHLIPALYGSEWIGMVLPLQILCVAGYFRALYNLGGPVAQSVGRVYGELWRQIVYAVLVIGGSVIARPYGVTGVAVAVTVAILFMYIAIGNLAIGATATTWGDYLRVQRDGLIISAITALTALLSRQLLEAAHMSPVFTALLILACSALSWCAGVAWSLRGMIVARREPYMPWLLRFARL
jgi:PST family polysaccharide transporter